MTKERKVSRKQLLKMIDELKKSPNDKFRILGETGFTLAGIGLGAASATTIASAAGATTALGSSALASALPFLATTTPVGWVIGSGAAVGFIVFAFGRVLAGGGIAEGRKLELLNQYREREQQLKAKETAGAITDVDRTQFIIALREIVEKDAIRPDQAFRLIEQVEAGRISLTQAFSTLQILL